MTLHGKARRGVEMAAKKKRNYSKIPIPTEQVIVRVIEVVTNSEDVFDDHRDSLIRGLESLREYGCAVVVDKFAVKQSFSTASDIALSREVERLDF